MQETQVYSLGQADPLEEGMATQSSILAWKIPWKGGAWQATVHGVAKSQTRLSMSCSPPPPTLHPGMAEHDWARKWGAGVGRELGEEAVPGPSVFPTREPGVSGDFWATDTC